MPTHKVHSADFGSTITHPSSASRESLADEELLLLRQATRLLGKSLDPGVIIREILHLLSELLGLNRGRVVLPDDGGNTLSIRYAYGLARSEIERGRYACGEGVTGKVMLSASPCIVQDIDAEPIYLGRAVSRTALPQETVAFIAVPIIDDRGVCGVLAVQRLSGRNRALSDDMEVLRTVAAMIGQILRLQRLVAERTAGLEFENHALRQALSTHSLPSGAIDERSTPVMSALNPFAQLAGHGGDRPIALAPGSDEESHARVYLRVEPADRQRLEQALALAGGNKSRAAQLLGLTLRQFNYRFKLLGLRRHPESPARVGDHSRK